MFKWFWAIFSLGAPDTVIKPLLLLLYDPSFKLHEEHFTFHLQYKHSGTFANRKCKGNILTPKIRKCADLF